MNYSKESRPAASQARARLSLRVVLSVAVAAAVIVTFAATRPAAAVARPLTPEFELLHAERFEVATPFRHVWRADQPAYTNGWLLVLAGDETKLQPRQTKEPVLYVGNQTAERINTAQGSGRLVVLVPGDLELAAVPAFLGGVALPEEVRQPQINAELTAALARGVVPFPAPAIANAVRGGVQKFATDYELRLRAIELVAQHSPAEQDLIQGWRAPLVAPR
jgi:hypothetical protein